MNKGAIQRFAIWARNELIAQMSQRAYQYGITKEGCGEANAVTVGGRALTGDEQKQRKELVDQIRSKGYTQVQPLYSPALYGGQQLSALPYSRLFRQYRRVQTGDFE